MTEDIDAIFNEMMEDVHLPEALPAIDYKSWSIPKLLAERLRISDILKDRKALVHPKTEEDQDLQGYYCGIVAELTRRGVEKTKGQEDGRDTS